MRLTDTNAEECPVTVPFSQCPNFFIISGMFLLVKQDLALRGYFTGRYQILNTVPQDM